MAARRPRRRESPSLPTRAQASRVSPASSSPSATSTESATAAGMTPAPTNVARLANGTAAGQRRQPSTDTSGATPDTQLARRSTSPSELAQPSLSQSPNLAGVPRRAAQEAAVSSPTSAENPVENSSPSANATAEPSPAQLALNKGTAGAAGVGQRPNLGRAEPAASSPAVVVSGAAARSRATQTMPFGPAMSPNSPAVVRRNRAGRTQPNATMRATPLAVTTRHGSQSPAEVNASSSAALTEAASNATAGPVTAARGKAEVDFGPTTVVSQAGQGPAAGGGQPETSQGSEPARLERSRSGQNMPASLSSDSLAQVPTAPTPDGAAPAGSASPSANPDAMVNSREGPPAPAAGGRPSIDGSALEGPATLMTNALERSENATVAQGASDSSERTIAMPRTSLRDRQLDVDPGVADLGDNSPGASGGQVASQGGSAAPSSLSMEKQDASGEPGGGRVTTTSGAAFANDDAVLTGGMTERAEAASATPGVATAGGGTQSPARESRGPQVVANTLASTIEIEGASPSSGADEAQPRQSLSDRTASVAGGLNSTRRNGPVGAIRGELPVDTGNLGGPGSGQSPVARSATDVAGPVIRDLANQGGPRRRTPFIDLPAVTSTVAANEVDSGHETVRLDSSDAGLAAGSLEAGRLDHSSSAALPVDIQAPDGPGGLGQQTTVEVGINSRRARGRKAMW